MSSLRRIVVSLIAAVIASTWGCTDSSTGTQAASPASLSVASGNAQSGLVGVQLAIPLTVVVTNASGAPVAGTVVRFQVTEGSGTVSPAIVTTDATGNASTQLTLGDAGTVRVTATVQGTSLTTSFSATAFAASTDCSTPISLAVGQVTTAINGGSICLAPTASAADYLLVPFYASSVSSARTTISVTAAGTTSPSASLDLASLSASLSRSLGASSAAPTAQLAASTSEFELALRERERRELTPLIPSARAWRRSLGTGGALRNSIPSSVAVGDLVQLNANADVACAQPNIRAGRVVAITTKAIIVADTVNPTGGFTNAEYQSIGVTFDTLVDPMDTRYFGAPSDIDNNGHVVIFFTKAVNDLTPASSSSYVGGFFFARDLFPLASTPTLDGCPTSNVGEMFYLMVPDPTRSSVFSKTNVTRVVISTLGHEYQHLINAARRLYVNTAADDFEEVWLNEGLSHVAEELLFYESSKLQPRANIDVTTIRRSQAYVDAFNNFLAANFGRYESYLEDPSDFSPFVDNDSLETRGATWSFLRYAADQRATSDGDFWFKLVNSTTTGIANLNQVLGTNALAVARNWSVSVATDDLAGFAAAYQQPSWNFRDVLAALRSNTVFPLATRTLSTAAPTSITLVAGGSAYLRFGVAASSSPTISWTAANASVQMALARTK
jgi:hypothetical protein